MGCAMMSSFRLADVNFVLPWSYVAGYDNRIAASKQKVTHVMCDDHCEMTRFWFGVVTTIDILFSNWLEAELNDINYLARSCLHWERRTC